MAKLYGKALWQNSMATLCSKLCARLYAKLYAIAKLYAMTKLYAVLSGGKTLFSKTSCNKFYAMTKLYAARLHATLCNFMQTLRQTRCNFMQPCATSCKTCRRRSLDLNQQPIIIEQQATMSANNGPFQGQTSIRFTPTRSDPNQSSSAAPSPQPHSTIPVPQFPLQLQLTQAMSDCKCSALDSS